MELHVRVLDGGLVSPQLACLEAGAPLRLGAPRGALALDTTSNRPVIMAAVSTGIAPLHAMLTQLAAAPAPPPVRLYYGALHRDGLYALDALEKLAAPASWLALSPVCYAADGPIDAALPASLPGCDAYLTGPAAMVTATTTALTRAGIPPGRVHAENFGWNEPEPEGS